MKSIRILNSTKSLNINAGQFEDHLECDYAQYNRYSEYNIELSLKLPWSLSLVMNSHVDFTVELLVFEDGSISELSVRQCADFDVEYGLNVIYEIEDLLKSQLKFEFLEN